LAALRALATPMASPWKRESRQNHTKHELPAREKITRKPEQARGIDMEPA